MGGVRTYYYGTAVRPARANDTYDGAWYGAQRAEGTRLVSRYLRLQPALGAQLLRAGLLRAPFHY